MPPSEDRGTLSDMQQSLPEGYTFQGESTLVTPSGLRFQMLGGAVDINQKGNTIHVPYAEWNVIAGVLSKTTAATT